MQVSMQWSSPRRGVPSSACAGLEAVLLRALPRLSEPSSWEAAGVLLQCTGAGGDAAARLHAGAALLERLLPQASSSTPLTPQVPHAAPHYTPSELGQSTMLAFPCKRAAGTYCRHVMQRLLLPICSFATNVGRLHLAKLWAPSAIVEQELLMLHRIGSVWAA